MVTLGAGLVAFVGTGKEVHLTVDGAGRTVQTYGGTVAEALAKAEVHVGAEDEVNPALDSPVTDGSTITVSHAHPVDLLLDGSGTTIHTTGETVGDLVVELGVAGAARVSVPLDTKLVTLSNRITVLTEKDVTVVVDGKTSTHTTMVAWLPELLDELGLTLGADDRLSIPASSAVVDGLGLKITRVVKGATVTEKEAMTFPVTERDDATLLLGEREVDVEGVDGERTRTFAVDSVDGREVSRRLVQETVTREPVAAVVRVGSLDPAAKAAEEAEAREAEEAAAREAEAASAGQKQSGGAAAAPASAAGPAPAGGPWAALAQCESGGNWSIDSGNGYYGGLQFSRSSWIGAGGGQYAPLPNQATPEQQIATAEVLRQSGGWGHWPSCARKLGLL
ncbi:resuscitation-promoting factor [Arthrobacter sp. B1805]|uniref:resuscitation-promoting factor n=1 Tax=Arthrobacter sp. B1805 TaxID=2058892 RepID=UPI000CE4272B|nr:resuscitation-promoting factor [Arthrobacter sp. B1805]